MARREGRNRKGDENEAQALKAVEKLSRFLEIPAVSFGGEAQIELAGNREAIVDGCQGILEYDENLVKINVGKMAVQFSGRNLCIRSMTQHSVIIEGYIVAIEFLT